VVKCQGVENGAIALTPVALAASATISADFTLQAPLSDVPVSCVATISFHQQQLWTPLGKVLVCHIELPSDFGFGTQSTTAPPDGGSNHQSASLDGTALYGISAGVAVFALMIVGVCASQSCFT
jgi:hypothetical protein